MRRFSIFLLSIFFFGLILPVLPLSAASASLFLSPSSGTYDLGKSFDVKVQVNSGGELGINAADGVIKFDPSHLTVSKVNNSGSIFSLWTTDPTYSNSAGTATWGGGAPGAYKGSAGTIFTITFSAKKAGDTTVSVTSGNVLAADGKGTNILSGMGSASFTISEPVAEEPREERPKPREEEPREEKPKGLLPPTPEVSSPSHPEEDTWYSNNEPEFAWKILADLTGISYLISDDATQDPGVINEGVLEAQRFEDQKDGEQYFHIKFQNQYGWGQASHRKLKIDATPPKAFNIKIDDKGDSTNPSPHLVFSTEDETSGIDNFIIRINNDLYNVKPEDVGKGYYQTPVLAPGEHEVQIAAIDKAGNAASSTVMVRIDPLKAPIITSIPKTVSSKDDLVVQGTSFYANVRVKVFIAKAGKDTIEGEAEADASGNWSYVYKGDLEKGSYEVWAIIIDDRGAQSLSSTKHLLIVVSPSIICSYGIWIVLFLLLLVALLAGYIWYQRNVFLQEKRRIKRETQELKVKMSKIFYALREEVDELIELADKKSGLSESERRVKEKLQESLDISEEFIAKEIEDVEKEINLPQKKS